MIFLLLATLTLHVSIVIASDTEDSFEFESASCTDSEEEGGRIVCATKVLPNGPLKPRELSVEEKYRKIMDHIQGQLPEELKTDCDATILAEELGWDIPELIPKEVIEKTVKKSGSKLERTGKIGECPICCDESYEIFRLDCCNFSACILCMTKTTKSSFEMQPTLTMKCLGAVTNECKDKYMCRSLLIYISPYWKNLALNRISYPCPYVNCCERVTLNGSGHCRAGHFSCVKCRSLPHSDMSCEQAADAEKAFEQNINGAETALGEGTVATQSRPCPKCTSPIYRVDGCNSMKCAVPSCLYAFCWGCGGQQHGHEFQTTTQCNPESVRKWNELLTQQRQKITDLLANAKSIVDIKEHVSKFNKISLMQLPDSVDFPTSSWYFHQLKLRGLLGSLLVKRDLEAQQFYKKAARKVRIRHALRGIESLLENPLRECYETEGKRIIDWYPIADLEEQLRK